MVGKIVKVSGPLVVAEGLSDANIADVVRVGEQRLIGEILNMKGDIASIQVYEDTGGLGPGGDVITTGTPMVVELGPGLLEGIYDGIQRPLEEIRLLTGDTITKGVDVPALNRVKRWSFTSTMAVGERVVNGDIIGTVQETAAILHKIMIPPDISGVITEIFSGEFTVEDTVAIVKDESGTEHKIKLMQRWPVRVGRPVSRKFAPVAPIQSGQRIVDTMFPIAKGGTAAVPGPFGSGKTVLQHALAKFSDVDVVVYIGCGERGNEMTDVLMEFPELVDPTSGEPLMKRTVLIANTSDMPVAAREASIYTGITIAEYFRDMGYDVAVIGDSTSRWAEALREMSGRLEEMPGEEGYPAYLGTRLAQFYERAGAVECLGSDKRQATLTAIGAVSPPGGDISEPVSQATLRIVKVFWGLEAALARARHFPAVNWLTSYSLYSENLASWYDDNLGKDFLKNRAQAMLILQEESSLQEIVRLVGVNSLSPDGRLTLETAKMTREDFLQQNAMMEIDCYSSYDRQAKLLQMILLYYRHCQAALAKGADIEKLLEIDAKNQISRAKAISAETYREAYDGINAAVSNQIKEALRESQED